MLLKLALPLTLRPLPGGERGNYSLAPLDGERARVRGQRPFDTPARNKLQPHQKQNGRGRPRPLVNTKLTQSITTLQPGYLGSPCRL